MSDSAVTTASLDPQQCQAAEDTAAWVLEEARRQGADAAEVNLNLAQGFSVDVRKGEVETVEFHRDRGVSITVFKGQRKGQASSSDDSHDSLRDTIAAACAIASYTEEDPCAGMASREQLASHLPALDLYHPWSVSTAEAIDQALQCEAEALNDSRMVNSEGASVGSVASMRVFGTTNGFLHSYQGTFHSRSCAVLAEDQGGMQRDYWYDSARDAVRLDGPVNVGQRARERTLARLGAGVPDTAEVPVLFAPEVASGLVGHLISAISGGSLYRRSSFLQGCLGESILPAGYSLFERPHLAGGHGSAPFDADGLATREQAFVEAGVLRQYALSLYAARRLKMDPTGNGGGVRNITISDSGENQQQLLQKMGRGVLVTEVMGQGVNLVTGDYSRGAAGFWVENGQIQHAIQEFTIAGNLRDMLASLAGSGTDVDRRGNVAVGSLLVPAMKVAGR